MQNTAETDGTVLAVASMHSRERHRLLAMTIALTALTVLHDVDHLRQGRGLPYELYVVAVFALVSLGAMLTLLLRRHRLAGTASLAQGVATVVGVGAVHVAPQWSSLTDSYSAARVDALSWAIILAMMLTGLALVVGSVAPWRREWVGRTRPSPCRSRSNDRQGDVLPASRCVEPDRCQAWRQVCAAPLTTSTAGLQGTPRTPARTPLINAPRGARVSGAASSY